METANMKVRRQTLKRLKLLAALQEDTMMNVLDCLVEAELARVQMPQTSQAQQKDASRAGDSRLQD
jgi:hypothetical protein